MDGIWEPKGSNKKKKNLRISEETNLTPANFSDLRKIPKEYKTNQVSVTRLIEVKIEVRTRL